MRWWEDPALSNLLSEEQLAALRNVREAALAIRCKTKYDSRAMTAGNMLPLLIKERGTEWAKEECKILLVLPISDDSQLVFRNAVSALIKLL